MRGNWKGRRILRHLYEIMCAIVQHVQEAPWVQMQLGHTT